MDLIIYYPIASYLLQDLVYEEYKLKEDSLVTKVYNKYSDVEVIKNSMNEIERRINGQLHGYNEPAMIEGGGMSGMIRYGREFMDIKKEVWFHRDVIHKDDGPAYTWINEAVEEYLFIKNGYIEKLVIKNIFGIHDPEYNKKIFSISEKIVDGNSIIYYFKKNRVRCYITMFCGYKLQERGYE